MKKKKKSLGDANIKKNFDLSKYVVGSNDLGVIKLSLLLLSFEHKMP